MTPMRAILISVAVALFGAVAMSGRPSVEPCAARWVGSWPYLVCDPAMVRR